jgi:hypothetical protein
MRVINEIIGEPSFVPVSKENKAILWMFRYSLTDKKEAIVKFLMSVAWSNEMQMKEAINLIN